MAFKDICVKVMTSFRQLCVLVNRYKDYIAFKGNNYYIFVA